MKALVFRGTNDMRLEDVEAPEPCRTKEALVKVRAVGICGSDVHGYRGLTGRRMPPMIMGHEAAGDVLKVGDDVQDFKAGERVVLEPIITCGVCQPCLRGRYNICEKRKFFGVQVNGAFAEYIKVPAKTLHGLPSSISYEHGAMIEPLSVAVHAVDRAGISVGENVAIIGAGTIGLLVLQVARLAGAGRVLITDILDYRLKIAKQLGADLTVNAAREDPMERLRELTQGSGFDKAIEAVGLSEAVEQAMLLTRNGGTVVLIGNLMKKIELDMQDLVTRELRLLGSYGFAYNFPKAIKLIEDEKVNLNALITHRMGLMEGVEAFRILAEGRENALKVTLLA